MPTRHPLGARAALLATTLLAACGDDAATPGGGASGSECVTRCEADATERARRFCGTDHQTWRACQWICGETPSGVGVFPEACADDGSPRPGSPETAADGVAVCDWVRVGSEWVAGECASNLTVNMGEMLGAGTEVSTEDHDRDVSSLPAQVSHRARYGAPKQQGSAPACLSFAATAAIEGAVRVASRQRVTLSEMHLLARHRSTNTARTVAAARSAIATDEQARALDLTYNARVAQSWIANRATPDATTVQMLDQMALFEVASVRAVAATMQAVTAEAIQRELARGNDLMIAFKMSDNWNDVSREGFIEDYRDGRRFGHAVLVVGYRYVDQKLYFELRNSWGAGWGDGGYGFLSAETAVSQLNMVPQAITVQRRSDAAAVDCAAGQAASLENVCRRVCPDGSLADADDQCPAGMMCPDGQTSDGADQCVPACTMGASMGDGFTVNCTARGCVWTLNDGVRGCRPREPGGTCEKFCPAPTCDAIVSMNEFGATVVSCGTGAN